MTSFAERQGLAEGAGNRFYGLGGTVHSTNHVDVMVDEHGQVQAVWFRCQLLPFKQGAARESDKGLGEYTANTVELHGVEVRDVSR